MRNNANFDRTKMPKIDDLKQHFIDLILCCSRSSICWLFARWSKLTLFLILVLAFFSSHCRGLRVWLITFFFGGASLLASPDLYRNVQAVIFDCDGILVDTEYLKFLAWQEALASEAIEFSIEEYMPLVGHSSKNILQMIKQSKKLEISDEVIKLKNDKYKMLQKRGVPTIQAMVDFARHLSANKSRLGISLGLASSASQSEILTNLQQIGLENAFDLVISGSDDLDDYIDEDRNKPKPYIYIEASKRLNIPPEFCLVFEDTTAGVDAAADAGMLSIAIPNQFTLNHDFSKAKRVFSSHEELPSIEVFNGNIDAKYEK